MFLATNYRNLTKKALQLLQADDGQQRPLLEKQLEHLISKQQIRKESTSIYYLDHKERARIEQSEQYYLSDLLALGSAYEQTIKDQNPDSPWNEDASKESTMLVTRLFILEQLDTLNSAATSSLVQNWMERLGNPEQDLRDLLQKHGIDARKINKTLHTFVELAKDRDVINKLSRTVTFVALEGKDPTVSATALGCRSWNEIKLLLDSSVAIPFLCERLFEPCSRYHFSISGNAVSLFEELGSSFFMLSGYIEECAAHLLRAYMYQGVEKESYFSGAFPASENAYISFYGALKAEGKLEGINLAEFLKAFSRKAASIDRSKCHQLESVRAIMPEVQSSFADYNVSHHHGKGSGGERYDSLSKAFDLSFANAKREKNERLRRHDLEALAFLSKRTESKDESWVMLTWDKVMIDVSRENLTRSFVIGPEKAMDFAQPCKSLSDSNWCALAHRLAIVSSPSDALTAKILDEVARLSPEKLYDAQFKKSLREYLEQELQSAPQEDDTKFHSWIEGRTKSFVHQHHLESKQSPEAADEAESTTQDAV